MLFLESYNVANLLRRIVGSHRAAPRCVMPCCCPLKRANFDTERCSAHAKIDPTRQGRVLFPILLWQPSLYLSQVNADWLHVADMASMIRTSDLLVLLLNSF